MSKNSGTKPKIIDSNLKAINTGSGGLVASYISKTVKAKGHLIEQQKIDFTGKRYPSCHEHVNAINKKADAKHRLFN
jgi:hypothetical protein